MPTSALPTEQIPLPHLPRELATLIEPGQTIPGHRKIYHLIGLGGLQMIEFVRGRWYCPRPELPALAQALGLRLKRRGRARPAVKAAAGKSPRSSARHSAA
jgi:hypothetical protein